MKNNTRIERKNELTEIHEALRLLQNWCNKYDNNDVENNVGYIYSIKGSYNSPILKQDIEMLDTPSKIHNYLEGIASYVSSIYYREEN